jgi:hypothetical protein
MLATPRRCEILPPPIRNKVWACLATRFNVQKKDVQSIFKLDQPITQYGRVCGLDGGDRMIGRHFVKKSEDSRDASFVRVEYSLSFHISYAEHSLLQYTQFVDRHVRHMRKSPDFEQQDFFGQLGRILVLELPSAPKLHLAEPTTVIVAVIREVKAKLMDGIYYYEKYGLDEVVDLETIQCVVGRIKERGKWALIDRSDSVVNNVD